MNFTLYFSNIVFIILISVKSFSNNIVDESTVITTEHDYLKFIQSSYVPGANIKMAFPSLTDFVIQDENAASSTYLVASKAGAPSQDIYSNIKATSYNVLSDYYLSINEFDKIPNFDWALINPETRLNNVIKRIDQIDADILCTQETSKALFIKLLNTKKDYTGIFMHSQNYHHQGVALFIRQSKFDPIHVEHIMGKHSPYNPTKSTLYLMLSQGNHQLTVACTHLPWYESAIRTETQTAQLHEEINAFFDPPNNIQNNNIIFLGDFNATADIIENNLNTLDNGNIKALSDENSYNTCFDDRSDKGRLYSVAEKVDHIYYSLTSDYSIKESCEDVGKCIKSNMAHREVILSTTEPSDHLPVSAILIHNPDS